MHDPSSDIPTLRKQLTADLTGLLETNGETFMPSGSGEMDYCCREFYKIRFLRVRMIRRIITIPPGDSDNTLATFKLLESSTFRISHVM